MTTLKSRNSKSKGAGSKLGEGGTMRHQGYDIYNSNSLKSFQIGTKLLAEHEFTIQKLKRRQYFISDIQKSPEVDFRKSTNKKRNQILTSNPPVNMKISKPQKIIP